MRTYEVEIQIAKTEIYHVKAKDDADLLEKNKGGFIEDEGKLIRIDTAESMIGSWKDISNDEKTKNTIKTPKEKTRQKSSKRPTDKKRNDNSHQMGTSA